MEDKIYNIGPCRLHVVNTNKFKSVEICLYFYRKINKKEITINNCLTDALCYASKKYPTKKELTIACQNMYSLFIASTNSRFGNCLLTKVGLSFLNPKYTEEGMLEKSIEMLREVIFNPLVTNKEFDENILTIIKRDLAAETRTIREQSRVYSNVRLLELMGKNEVYSLTGYSDLEELKKVNGKNLYKYYQKFLKETKLEIVVVGEVDPIKIEQLIRENFSGLGNLSDNFDVNVNHQLFKKRIHKVIEKENYQQSKLAIGCKIKDITPFEYKYVSSMYNMILGGNSDSLFMRIIREKKSLAYYAVSSLSKADNLIIINSGIDGRNFNKVVNLIKKIMDELRNGNFSEDDLYKSQMDYIGALDSSLDSCNGVVEMILGKFLFGTDDIETRKRKVLEVTKKDIMDFAQKVYMDTIYLLKGE